jgi:transcriptional regulator with GAF, ATPase, and Fis domain
VTIVLSKQSNQHLAAMKKISLLFSVLALAAVVSGCKSISTRSTTHFFSDSGQEIAQRKEHTHSTGFFVKGESVSIQGTLSFTNVIAVSNAPVILIGETKTFNAGKITTSTDAEGIKATGGAIGEAAKAVLEK